FTINAKNGVVSMIARDYEKPVDKDKDNVYKVTIIATDGDRTPPLKTWELQLRMYLNLYQKQSLLMGWIT
ncbi:hypothetical protein BSPWISOXPB_2894, partial [uncultured Gammaproteobacteria bacterium]